MSDTVQHRNLYLHTYVCCLIMLCVLTCFSLSFSLNSTYVHQWKWTSPRVTTSVSRLYFVYILACNWLNGNKCPAFSSIKHTILKHLKLLHILSAYFWKIQFISNIFLCFLLTHTYSTHQDTCFCLWSTEFNYSVPFKPILSQLCPFYVYFLKNHTVIFLPWSPNLPFCIRLLVEFYVHYLFLCRILCPTCLNQIHWLCYYWANLITVAYIHVRFMVVQCYLLVAGTK